MRILVAGCQSLERVVCFDKCCRHVAGFRYAENRHIPVSQYPANLLKALFRIRGAARCFVLAE